MGPANSLIRASRKRACGERIKGKICRGLGSPQAQTRWGGGGTIWACPSSFPALSEAPAVVPRKIQPHPGNVGSSEMRIWGIMEQNLSAPLGNQSGVAATEEPSCY